MTLLEVDDAADTRLRALNRDASHRYSTFKVTHKSIYRTNNVVTGTVINRSEPLFLALYIDK